jgi:hypothetical protein
MIIQLNIIHILEPLKSYFGNYSNFQEYIKIEAVLALEWGHGMITCDGKIG